VPAFSIVRNNLHVDHTPHLTEFNNLKFKASIKQIETELEATSSQISAILATYFIFQGVGPFLWSAVSEIKGRKVKIPYPHLTLVHFLAENGLDDPQPVYIVGIVISLIGFIAAAEAKTIGILIGMRAVQAIG
jgi:MFS family permease